MTSVAPSVPAKRTIPDSDASYTSAAPDVPIFLDSELVTIPTRETFLSVQQCGSHPLGDHEIRNIKTQKQWPFAFDAGSMLTETNPLPDNHNLHPPKSHQLGNSINR